MAPYFSISAFNDDSVIYENEQLSVTLILLFKIIKNQNWFVSEKDNVELKLILWGDSYISR